MTIEKQQLDWLRSDAAPRPHVFLGSASYEDRCLSVASHLRMDDIQAALICENSSNKVHVGENLSKITSIFGNAANVVSIDRTKPLKIADAWMAALGELPNNGPRHFLFDITTFTHEALLILLKLLCMYVTDRDSVTCVYSSASEYDSPRTGQEKWLSKGVQDVRSVLGYPGLIRPSRKTHLIILVGYEHERAARLIQVFEPNRVSLGKGGNGTSTNEKHQASNERFHLLASEMAAKYAPVETFEFPCNDPWGTKAAVIAQSQKFQGCNVVVAPMNTKISTVGCALAASDDESIQLCYAQPMRYNYAHYSTPGDTCYLFELPEISDLHCDRDMNEN